ncbi:hypothetical protein Anapl_03831 [Anas platyrhynchos]|uniref:Uncharacterized protein n=1 Tax=Anas platyrhynchos TaxID=8839 RepID=R0JJZ9_ANAPL|nr:hypothetical protein Anapl_03831 [Anas platyrhynchos]
MLMLLGVVLRAPLCQREFDPRTARVSRSTPYTLWKFACSDVAVLSDRLSILDFSLYLHSGRQAAGRSELLFLLKQLLDSGGKVVTPSHSSAARLLVPKRADSLSSFHFDFGRVQDKERWLRATGILPSLYPLSRREIGQLPLRALCQEPCQHTLGDSLAFERSFRSSCPRDHACTLPVSVSSLGELVRAALWLGGFLGKLEERDGSDKPYLVSSAVVGSVTAPVPSLVQGIRSPQHINSLVGQVIAAVPVWEQNMECASLLTESRQMNSIYSSVKIGS